MRLPRFSPHAPAVAPVLLAVLLAACTAGSAAKDDSGGSDSSVGDSGSSSAACGSYFPAVGAALVYDFPGDTNAADSLVNTFTSYDGSSATAVMTTASRRTNQDGSLARQDTTATFNCAADGVYIDTAHSDYQSTGGANDYSGSSDTTYTPPMLVYPATVTAGGTWTETSTATTVDTTSGTTTSNLSFSATVGDQTSLTVPAGTYDVLPVTQTPTAGNPFHSWLAVGIGAVKTDGTELKSVE